VQICNEALHQYLQTHLEQSRYKLVEPVALHKLSLIKRDDPRRFKPDKTLHKDIEVRLKKTQPGYLIIKVGCKVIKVSKANTITIPEVSVPIEVFIRQELTKVALEDSDISNCCLPADLYQLSTPPADSIVRKRDKKKISKALEKTQSDTLVDKFNQVQEEMVNGDAISISIIQPVMTDADENFTVESLFTLVPVRLRKKQRSDTKHRQGAHPTKEALILECKDIELMKTLTSARKMVFMYEKKVYLASLEQKQDKLKVAQIDDIN